MKPKHPAAENSSRRKALRFVAKLFKSARLSAERGRGLLEFDQAVAADVVELAFFVTPPKAYLGPSSRIAVWCNEPHYFAVSRALDASSTSVFEADPGITKHISDKAEVTVSSRDGLIHASTTWKAPAVRASRRRGLAAATAVIVVALIGAGAYALLGSEEQAKLTALAQKLDAAGYDRTALDQVQSACGSSCPDGLRRRLQGSLDQIASEEASFRATQDDPDKLQGYIDSCKACFFKDDAGARIRALERLKQAELKNAAEQKRISDLEEQKRQEARNQSVIRQLADAGNDREKLQQLVASCGNCPRDLVEEARRRIDLVGSDEQMKTDNQRTELARREQMVQSASEKCDRLAGGTAGDPQRSPGAAGVALTAIDAGAAIEACRNALDLNPNDPRLTYQLGRALQQARRYAEAIPLYRLAANQRNPNAMVDLGAMYQSGVGVAKDHAEAVRLYRTAADQGNTGAMVNLGTMYANGWGVTKDHAQAARLYRKAAEAGDVKGMQLLGAMFEAGRGVRRDYVAAVSQYQKAADLGSPVAMARLGAMYANGRGIARDDAQAVRLLRKAVALGYTPAQATLDVIMSHGLATSR